MLQEHLRGLQRKEATAQKVRENKEIHHRQARLDVIHQAANDHFRGLADLFQPEMAGLGRQEHTEDSESVELRVRRGRLYEEVAPEDQTDADTLEE